ncbi:ankyrin repeat domain-containing protein [Stieleria sp. TO1_6]|uniref:ankyrin repeat domain-containing protein n=1 Tax=Stieleria tagensis TaxID=2956795 RepID=UPI00209AB5C6|nr:ankyrin repeat domain-containing protein [Stieleria tagensis]MCO8125558.1 ankyrin repeat domain-containing protein [Stieleria tagensis]
MKLTRADIRRLLENDGYKTFDENGNPASIPVAEQRRRAMESACEWGYVDLASELHQMGVDIAANTELLRIAADAHQHEIALFLIQMGADVNGRSEQFGQPPIMDAAGSGALAVFELLIAHGADMTAVCDDGTSALDWARNGKNTIENMDWVRTDEIVADYDTIIAILDSDETRANAEPIRI